MVSMGDKVAVIARNSVDKKYAEANATNTHIAALRGKTSWLMASYFL
jgi:hypothetical protein